MRKKKNVVSFILGVCLVLMMWLYSSSFSVVGQINGEPIYSYQLRRYQKAEKYNEIKAVADEILREQAKELHRTEKKEGESFEEYFENYKQQSDFRVY